MKKRFITLAMAALSCATIMCGCGGYEGTLEDEYTADGKLIIDFFGHDLDSITGLTPESRKILNYVENKFEIKFNITTATVASSPTLLNQLIGGGDVPDMFIHFKEEPVYTKWLDDEYLFDYSEYLDDYPQLKQNFTALGSEETVKNFLGGGYYSYPIVLYSNADSGELFTQIAMYYRRDWYQALVNKNWTPSSGRALKDPEDPTFNYENFYDLCEGFTVADPDGNGTKDTVGYGLNKDSGIYWWYPLLNMWNIHEEGWEYNETTSQWEPEILTERGKNAVMWIADMYDNGYINGNYNTTTTYEMAKSDFCSGQSGIICYNAIPGVPEGIMENMKQFVGKVAGTTKIGDVVRGMPVVTGVDGVKRIQGAVNNYGYMAINNDISETKKRKIMELMNWILTEEGDTVLTWGLENDHWEYASDGTTKVSLLPLDNNNNQHLLKNDSIAPAAFRLKGIASWEIKYTNMPRGYVQESEQVLTAWKKEHMVIDELTFIRVPNNYATIASELKDKVTTVCKNIVAKIPNNAESVRNSYWNALADYWDDRGGDYIKAINQAAKDANVSHE